jgi:hypothetical protein
MVDLHGPRIFREDSLDVVVLTGDFDHCSTMRGAWFLIGCHEGGGRRILEPAPKFLFIFDLVINGQDKRKVRGMSLMSSQPGGSRSPDNTLIV